MLLVRDWQISIHFACFCFWMTVMIIIGGSVKHNRKFGFKLQSSHVIEKCIREKIMKHYTVYDHSYIKHFHH